MNDMLALLAQWQMDVRGVRERVYRAETPRERERWHAVWLLTTGWSQAQVAKALERDAHTIAEWVDGFCKSGASGLVFEQTGG